MTLKQNNCLVLLIFRQGNLEYGVELQVSCNHSFIHFHYVQNNRS